MTDWLDNLLEAFGRSIGIPSLGLNESGVMALALERDGDLYVERGGDDDEALIYLARRWPYGDVDRCLAALKGCAPQRNASLTLTAGLARDSQLVFLARARRDAMDLPAFENVLRILTGLHAASEGG